MSNTDIYICIVCGGESSVGCHGLTNDGEMISKYYCETHYNDLKRGNRPNKKNNEKD